MTLELRVDKPAAKIGASLAVVILSALLAFILVRNFFIGALSDERVPLNRDSLASGVAYLPDSATVLARLAATEMQGEQRDLSSAEGHASRAIKRSPWDYRNRLLLARIKEAQGDRPAAEQCLQDALALAPNYTDVHWRLANVLLREGKLAKSVAEFRSATASDISLLPETLDVLWRLSGNNVAVVNAVAPRQPEARLVLSQFLLSQSRVPEALEVFGEIERDALLLNPDTSRFIEQLIKAGHLEEAQRVWVAVITGNQPVGTRPGIWNGGFESDISPALSTFDWSVSRNEYVVAAIDGGAAHTGARSLRLDFLGRDTTRMDGQLKQLIVLSPGSRYRVECFVRTKDLVTPEGPRVVVTDARTSIRIASSDPIAGGSGDWQRIAFEFDAPAAVRAAFISVTRVPRFSYDDPTRGSVWFDDVSLIEQRGK